jgi:hypothetical protein
LGHLDAEPDNHIHIYPDTHSNSFGNNYFQSNPDTWPNRYCLGHLDAEPDAHQYHNPYDHPDPASNSYIETNLDTQPERYPLAGPNSHQVKNARDYYRSQPSL